eukprot:3843282-Rhodomonas_salina.1
MCIRDRPGTASLRQDCTRYKEFVPPYKTRLYCTRYTDPPYTTSDKAMPRDRLWYINGSRRTTWVSTRLRHKSVPDLA